MGSNGTKTGGNGYGSKLDRVKKQYKDKIQYLKKQNKYLLNNFKEIEKDILSLERQAMDDDISNKDVGCFIGELFVKCQRAKELNNNGSRKKS